MKSFVWSISKIAQWVSFDQSGEQFLKKLEIYPMGIVWVNFKKKLKKLKTYSLSNTPSAPSERGYQPAPQNQDPDECLRIKWPR